MKEVRKDVVTVVTEYQAVDGTLFATKESCIEYEKSAKGVLMARLKRITVNDRHTHWDLMAGGDDTKIIAVRIKDKGDADIVLQNILLDQPYLVKDENRKRFEEIEKTLYDAIGTSDVILLGCNSYDDNTLWLLGSRQNIVDKLMSLDKKEDNNV